MYSIIFALCTIFSVHAAQNTTDQVFTDLENLESSLCRLNSETDNVNQSLVDVFAKACGTQSLSDFVESKIANTDIGCTIDDEAALSTLDVAQSKINLISSHVDNVSKEVTAANNCLGTAVSSPRQLTSPGRYYLTQNVSRAGGSFTIFIDSDDVYLDLNGFTVSNTGDAAAIRIQDQNKRNITIANGFIEATNGGLNNDGIIISGDIRYIQIKDVSIISNNRAIDNAFFNPNILRHVILKRLNLFGQDPGVRLGADLNAEHILTKDVNIVANGATNAMFLSGFNKGIYRNISINVTLASPFDSSPIRIESQRNFIDNCSIFSDTTGTTRRNDPAIVLESNNNVVRNSFTRTVNTGGGTFGGSPHGIEVTGDTNAIFNNTCAASIFDGINANNGANNYIADNVCIENGRNNIRSGSTNSVLGNFAFGAGGSNYAGTSATSKEVTISQSTGFPGTAPIPSRWDNIDMTT